LFFALCGTKDNKTYFELKFGDGNHKGYPKKVKETRSVLLFQWLNDLAMCCKGKYRPSAKKYFLIAKGQGLFSGSAGKKRCKQLEHLFCDK